MPHSGAFCLPCSNAPGFLESKRGQQLRYADYAFTGFFTLEALTKMLSQGILLAPNTYMRNGACVRALGGFGDGTGAGRGGHSLVCVCVCVCVCVRACTQGLPETRWHEKEREAERGCLRCQCSVGAGAGAPTLSKDVPPCPCSSYPTRWNTSTTVTCTTSTHPKQGRPSLSLLLLPHTLEHLHYGHVHDQHPP